MARPIAPDFVDKVRSAVDIVALISEMVPLKKAGRKFRGLCPFHPEKTPSFYIDDAKGLFYCFGCQAGGDAFKFVMMRENVEFLEAAKILASRLGIPVPEARSGRPSEREALISAHRAAADFYHDVLLHRPEAAPARRYLAGRGISDRTVEALRIGFAPDRWDALKGHLAAKGFSTPILLAGGLLAQREGRSTTYDRFRKRIVFPIRSLSGDVIGFGGRLTGPGEPKYLNSAETPLYNKRENLFGLDQTRHGIRDAGEAVVVEGYFDFASLLQAGVTNVVATLGTAFSEEQVGLLRRFSDRVVINYDPDTAGASATRRSIDLLLAQGFKVRVLELDEGQDPDDFVRRQGVETYRSRLAAAPKFFEYLLDKAVAGKDLTDYEAKSAALKDILPVISRIPDRIERAGYVNTLASRLAIDDDLMLAEVRDALVKGQQARTAPTLSPGRAPARIGEAEGRLIRALLETSEIRHEVLASVAPEDLEGSLAGEIVRAIDGLSSRSTPVTYQTLSDVLREPARSMMASLAMRPEPVVSRDEALRCAESLRLRRLRVERDRLQKEMENEADSERIEELMSLKMEVSRQIDSLS